MTRLRLVLIGLAALTLAVSAYFALRPAPTAECDRAEGERCRLAPPGTTIQRNLQRS